MEILDLLQGNLPSGLMDLMGKQVGVESNDQTEAAVNGILSTLTAAISKNASSPEGANALVSALDRDHDGSIFDDVVGFLGGQRQASNASMLNGAGILRHVLGGRQNNVVDMIGRMSGLDESKVGQLMMMLAPMVMGALGKARNQGGMNIGGISDLLNQTVKSEENKRSEMSLLTRFLDKDGDGSVMDDIANMGIQAFLRRR
jgi:hypothetical protein